MQFVCLTDMSVVSVLNGAKREAQVYSTFIWKTARTLSSSFTRVTFDWALTGYVIFRSFPAVLLCILRLWYYVSYDTSSSLSLNYEILLSSSEDALCHTLLLPTIQYHGSNENDMGTPCDDTESIRLRNLGPDPQGWDPWKDVVIHLEALTTTIGQVLRKNIENNQLQLLDVQGVYAKVYKCTLSDNTKVVARLLSPARPFLKTEAEVAAMDYLRNKTSIPVPYVYAYCSDARNPVGTEWIIMEFMEGVDIDSLWDNMNGSQKRRMALDIVDMMHQLSKLKGQACGGIYHTTRTIDDIALLTRTCKRKRNGGSFARSLRWNSLDIERLRELRKMCGPVLNELYDFGPLQETYLSDFEFPFLPFTQTPPIFTSHDYVRLLACRGVPSSRPAFRQPVADKIVALYDGLKALYPNSRILGPDSDPYCFRFAHGDMHATNVLLDPHTGAVTAVLDWETAGFKPIWAKTNSGGCLEEDEHRFMFDIMDPRNFEHDTPLDTRLRSLFRKTLHETDDELFMSFFGGIEFRSLLRAACSSTGPSYYTAAWLSNYIFDGHWSEQRRGPFPFNAMNWLLATVHIDTLLVDMYFQNLGMTQDRLRDAVEFMSREYPEIIKIWWEKGKHRNDYLEISLAVR